MWQCCTAIHTEVKWGSRAELRSQMWMLVMGGCGVCLPRINSPQDAAARQCTVWD